MIRRRRWEKESASSRHLGRETTGGDGRVPERQAPRIGQSASNARATVAIEMPVDAVESRSRGFPGALTAVPRPWADKRAGTRIMHVRGLAASHRDYVHKIQNYDPRACACIPATDFASSCDRRSRLDMQISFAPRSLLRNAAKVERAPPPLFHRAISRRSSLRRFFAQGNGVRKERGYLRD